MGPTGPAERDATMTHQRYPTVARIAPNARSGMPPVHAEQRLHHRSPKPGQNLPPSSSTSTTVLERRCDRRVCTMPEIVRSRAVAPIWAGRPRGGTTRSHGDGIAQRVSIAGVVPTVTSGVARPHDHVSAAHGRRRWRRHWHNHGPNAATRNGRNASTSAAPTGPCGCGVQGAGVPDGRPRRPLRSLPRAGPPQEDLWTRP